MDQHEVHGEAVAERVDEQLRVEVVSTLGAAPLGEVGPELAEADLAPLETVPRVVGLDVAVVAPEQLQEVGLER